MASRSVEVKRFLRDRLDRKILLGLTAATSSALVLAYLYRKMANRNTASEKHPVSLDNQTQIGEVCMCTVGFSRRVTAPSLHAGGLLKN